MKTDLVTPKKEASQDPNIDLGQDKSRENIDREANLIQEEADTDITKNIKDITETGQEAKTREEEDLLDKVKMWFRKLEGRHPRREEQ